MTDIYLHIVARMADYIHTHPYLPGRARLYQDGRLKASFTNTTRGGGGRGGGGGGGGSRRGGGPETSSGGRARDTIFSPERSSRYAPQPAYAAATSSSTGASPYNP